MLAKSTLTKDIRRVAKAIKAETEGNYYRADLQVRPLPRRLSPRAAHPADRRLPPLCCAVCRPGQG